MQRYWLARLADHVLVHDLKSLVAKDRQNTADLLAHLAEVDARKLYAPAGYDSMYAWCVGALGFSEDMACKRIEAARVARRFPAIFEAVADGRLHVSGLLVLAPHLTSENAGDLLVAASHMSRSQIAELIAERFPRPDMPTVIGGDGDVALALAFERTHDDSDGSVRGLLSAPGRINLSPPEHAGCAPASVSAPERTAPRARLTLLSADRVALQVTLARSTVEQLRYAQALLGHAVAPGDVAEVLDRALAALVVQLEKRRFAKRAPSVPACDGQAATASHAPSTPVCDAPPAPSHAPSAPACDAQPAPGHTRSAPAPGAQPATASHARSGSPTTRAARREAGPDPRHIPAHVRREVWARDRGRCTFVSADGHACAAERDLELDHVIPVARGGLATAANLRLRCGTHNQMYADQTFGAAFMKQKRDVARRARTPTRSA